MTQRSLCSVGTAETEATGRLAPAEPAPRARARPVRVLAARDLRGVQGWLGVRSAGFWARVAILALLVSAAVVVVAAPNLELRTNRYVPFYGLQAQSLLEGRLDITLPPGWTHDVIRGPDGRTFFALPPLNGFLLVPFVALLGPDVPERAFTLVVYAAYLALLAVFLTRYLRAPLSAYAAWMAFFAFGTNLITCAAAGTSWFSACLVSSFLLALGALVLWRARTLGAATLGVTLASVAALGRFHLLLPAAAMAGAAWYLRFRHDWRKLLVLGLPLLGFAAFVAWWNWARFGSPFGLHYREHGYAAAFQGAVERYGFTSWRYVFPHLYHGLLGAPRLVPAFPFLEVDLEGNGILAMSPVFLYAVFRARTYARSDWLALGCLLLTAIPIVTHFSTGWSQAGYRYALDVFPFLCFLLFRAKLDIRSPLALALVAFSVWMNTAATLLWLRA